MHRSAVLRCDGEVQCVSGAEPKHMLIGKFGRALNCAPVTPSTVKLSATSLLNMASAAAR